MLTFIFERTFHIFILSIFRQVNDFLLLRQFTDDLIEHELRVFDAFVAEVALYKLRGVQHVLHQVAGAAMAWLIVIVVLHEVNEAFTHYLELGLCHLDIFRLVFLDEIVLRQPAKDDLLINPLLLLQGLGLNCVRLRCGGSTDVDKLLHLGLGIFTGLLLIVLI